MEETATHAPELGALLPKLDACVERLAEKPAFAKQTARSFVLDVARRVLARPGGAEALYERAEAMEEAGLFHGTDWARPDLLQPSLTRNTLRFSDPQTAVLDCLSQIRLLAVAGGAYPHPRVSDEQARHFVSQVLALNLSYLFEQASEADRERGLAAGLRNLYRFIADRIGYENVIDRLIDEIWRILSQRPIVLDDVKTMITQIAVCLADPAVDTGGAGRGAERLISALYGPTAASREDPGLEVYAERLDSLDRPGLMQEASGFARAMHDTGLVSPYHTIFLRQAPSHGPDLVVAALGLSSTGRDAFLCYRQLVLKLIEEAVFPETAQAVYGLALMLERGCLYSPGLGPALWRQINLALCPRAEHDLAAALGSGVSPRAHLLGGVLSVLGQPLGVGQGNNPTCQAARAISMWGHSDPDFLLQLITWAARDDEVVFTFEGKRLSSSTLAAGLAARPPLDVDPVSVLLVPHLDRIYMEMGRLVADRGGDPHVWINPQFHGWWVGLGSHIAVDVATGKLRDYELFVRRFYGVYHPMHNGNNPLIHPQPAGIAITDSAARFVGWHAIAIYRVAIDPSGVMRVYFYNPNNDSGQDWGGGIVVSTTGNGERPGESSLPIDQFASRLYFFHLDPLEGGSPESVPSADVEAVEAMARASWARDR